MKKTLFAACALLSIAGTVSAISNDEIVARFEAIKVEVEGSVEKAIEKLSAELAQLIEAGELVQEEADAIVANLINAE